MVLPRKAFLQVRFGIAFLFLFTFGLVARAEELKCDVCGKPITGHFYTCDDRIEGKKKNICRDCEQIKARCYLCEMPVLNGYLHLEDDRYICARDLKTVVTSEAEAKSICETVNYDLDRLLARFMTYPDNKTIQLAIVDRFRLDALFHAPGSESSCVSVYGATSSHPLPNHTFVHTVDILSHLPKSRLMAVCAHEYTHTWMNENLSHERLRSIDKNVMEGFCELIAYTYMESLEQKDEMATITKNHYTVGKIQVLIAARDTYGFNTVMEWMKNGEDFTLTLDNIDRVRALRDGVAPRQIASATAGLIYGSAPAPAPTTLLLKSISGSEQRRFALINSTTFEANEKERVRVGTNMFMVRCLEINKDSVVVQVDGSPEKKQLFLRSQ